MSDWHAHTAYQVEVGFELDPDMAFRQTPDGQLMVPQLAGPGSIVRTNYGTGPYRVIAVTGPHLEMGCETWSLTCEELDRPGQAYLNELVAVDGRLLHLFGNNDDEVIVMSGGQLTLL
jgi:hypothetical protein